MTRLADSGWAEAGQWMVLVGALALMVAVAVFSQMIRRHNRKGWIGIGAVVAILGMGVLVSYPASVSHS